MTHETESPLQSLVLAGSKTSCPDSVPIMTVLVSAAYAGAPTTLRANPAARPAARVIATRRAQYSSDSTTLLRLLLSAFASARSRFMWNFLLRAFISGAARVCAGRVRHLCPLGHFVPGSSGKSLRSPSMFISRSSASSSSSTSAGAASGAASTRSKVSAGNASFCMCSCFFIDFFGSCSLIDLAASCPRSESAAPEVRRRALMISLIEVDMLF
mmetsp:Transcript_24633/g.33771  ORF Transcript_24633/g.33771 Transcript_24633/m.33771 type:complete len:214 (-) Transcript_24633:113-754(-)